MGLVKKRIPLGKSYDEMLKNLADLSQQISLVLKEEGVVVSGGMTKLLDKYLVDRKRRVRPSTMNDYNQCTKQLKKHFGDFEPETITKAQVGEFLLKRRYENNQDTIPQANKEVKFLGRVLDWDIKYHDGNYINPVKQVELFTEKLRDVAPTPAEANEFKKIASPFISAYIDLKLATGLRQSDLLNLPKTVLQDEVINFVIVKTQRKATLKITPEIRRLLYAVYDTNTKKSKAYGEYIIMTRSGTKLSSKGFNSRWTKIQKKLPPAERFHEHDLRASHAIIFNAQFGVVATQQQLCHSDVKQTE